MFLDLNGLVIRVNWSKNVQVRSNNKNKREIQYSGVVVIINSAIVDDENSYIT